MRHDRIQNPLRAVAAELALLAPEDVDAILLELAEDQRSRLRNLLATQAASARDTVDVSVSLFSPWLAERISGSERAASCLTDQTKRTLAKLASDLTPAPDRKARQTAAASPGLFQRLLTGGSWR